MSNERTFEKRSETKSMLVPLLFSFPNSFSVGFRSDMAEPLFCASFLDHCPYGRSNNGSFWPVTFRFFFTCWYLGILQLPKDQMNEESEVLENSLQFHQQFVGRSAIHSYFTEMRTFPQMD